MSVVIVSWNVRDLLVQCVQAVLRQEDSVTEIIVVDNASSDGSAGAARQLDRVRVIESRRNLGYGRANNVGLKEAQGEYLLVLNPDTVPQPGSLSALVGFAREHPCAGIVSPRLLNRDGSIQEAAFRFPTLLMGLIDLFPLPPIVPGRIRRWVSHSRLNGRYAEEEALQPIKIDHPLGACMLINREAYRQMGGFDEAIFMYSEEIELALRYARAGWQCWQVPQARVMHLGGQSTKQMPSRMFVELWRSRLYVYRKHYNRASQATLAALLMLSQALDIARTLVEVKMGRITREEARKRWARARATLKLVRKR